MGKPEMPHNIKVGVVFLIEKGKRKSRYKIIPHPFFNNAYALIGDHELICYSFEDIDIKHIISGSKTIEGAWENAYDHT